MPFPVARILLAEDLLINQELTRRTLEAVGHHVDVVPDGAAALAAAENGSYDLILMDVHMPVMDGIAATYSIRALDGPAHMVPIIALTSYTHPTDVAKFGPAGMDSYLAKPYSDQELYTLVDLWHSEGALRKPTLHHARIQPALDPVIFQGIERMMGAERIRGLLAILRKAFCEPITGDTARFTLHSLVSQAGQIGFVDLSNAARSLEAAFAEDKASGLVVEQFVSARAKALLELDRRLAA